VSEIVEGLLELLTREDDFDAVSVIEEVLELNILLIVVSEVLAEVGGAEAHCSLSTD